MNAREELLAELIGKDEIVCAYMHCYDSVFILKENYTEDELDNFLSLLNFNYDDGYGIQVLYGTVWLKNNAWLERNEYDGAEWWERKGYPDIPELLTTKS